jgi:hypothetical protein
MNNQRAAPDASFCYNLDSDFQTKLNFSLQGLANAAGVMLILGHEPCVPRLENALRRVFKDPSAKRDRTSDLVCARCGQRFEAKAKSQDRFLYIGPDLLTQYALEDAIIVFTFPGRVLAVRAKELDALREQARPGRNRDGEPFLDFSRLKVPAILEIRRQPQCAKPTQ